MWSRSIDNRPICPWCLKPVAEHVCRCCERTPWPAHEFNLKERMGFSRLRFDNRYQVTRYIGRGGFGEVYQAYDRIADTMVAVKFMTFSPGSGTRGQMIGDMFFTECQALAQLRSPHIVSFIDLEYVPNDTPAIVMELLRGRNLATLLVVARRLDLQQIVDIGVPVCRALQAAHDRGYAHLDLKPENVFIQDLENGDRVVKVLDFGLARAIPIPGARGVRGPRKDRMKWVLGTCNYMSPEQCTAEPVSNRSDLFSFGVMLYEMISGNLPFNGPDERGIMNAVIGQEHPAFTPDISIPAPLEQLIDALLAKQPVFRPQSAREVEELLIRACGVEPSPTARLDSLGIGNMSLSARSPVPVSGSVAPLPACPSCMPPPIAPDSVQARSTATPMLKRALCRDATSGGQQSVCPRGSRLHWWLWGSRWSCPLRCWVIR